MIVELGLVIIGFYMYKYLNTSEKRKFKIDFKDIISK